nr:tetratricopeptide repeat protein [uncultured Actinoplanes sp.]
MTGEPAAVAAAREAVENQRYDEAIGLLREHLRHHPDDPRGWHRLSGALSGADRKREALEAADRATTLAPDDAAAHRMRALALLFLKRFPEAQQAASRSIELDPAHPEPHALLGEALRNQRRRSGNDSIRTALALDPENRAALAAARRWNVSPRMPGVLAGRLSARTLTWLVCAVRGSVVPIVLLGLLSLLLLGGDGAAVLGLMTLGLIVVAGALGLAVRLAQTPPPGWRVGAAVTVGGAVVVGAALLAIAAPWQPVVWTVLLAALLELVVWFGIQRPHS